MKMINMVARGEVMRKLLIFTIAILCVSGEAFAAKTKTILNYPTPYSGTRALGMGNAFAAVGRDPDGVFYNPATLYEMDFNIGLIEAQVEVNQNSIDLIQDVMDLTQNSTGQDSTDAAMNLVETNMGKLIHARVTDYSRLAWKSFVIGAFGGVNVDTRLHYPLSSTGIVEARAITMAGGVVGGSRAIEAVEGLRLGMSVKQIATFTLQHSFKLADVMDQPDPNDLMYQGQALVFDIGGLYNITQGKLGGWNSQAGLSFMNIGGIQYTEEDTIPMTVNLGISMRPETFLGETIFAVDIHDLFFAYPQDSSLWKRVHMGMEFGVLGRHLLFRAGLTQGFPTAGFALDLWIFKVGYAYSAEEMGAYAGQDKDSRHTIHLSAGW